MVVNKSQLLRGSATDKGSEPQWMWFKLLSIAQQSIESCLGLAHLRSWKVPSVRAGNICKYREDVEYHGIPRYSCTWSTKPMKHWSAMVSHGEPVPRYMPHRCFRFEVFNIHIRRSAVPGVPQPDRNPDDVPHQSLLNVASLQFVVAD